jgi:dCMP deaminase
VERHQILLQTAKLIAKQSTCLDKQVGCIIVDKFGYIISTGYNGSPRGFTHCSDIGYCAKERKKHCVAVHAEINAVIQCNITKIYTIYCTLSPCHDCLKILLNTPCKKIYFSNYSEKSQGCKKLWQQANRIWRQL